MRRRSGRRRQSIETFLGGERVTDAPLKYPQDERRRWSERLERREQGQEGAVFFEVSERAASAPGVGEARDPTARALNGVAALAERDNLV